MSEPLLELIEEMDTVILLMGNDTVKEKWRQLKIAAGELNGAASGLMDGTATFYSEMNNATKRAYKRVESCVKTEIFVCPKDNCAHVAHISEFMDLGYVVCPKCKQDCIGA